MKGVQISLLLSGIAWGSGLISRELLRKNSISDPDDVSSCANPQQCWEAFLVPSSPTDFDPENPNTGGPTPTGGDDVIDPYDPQDPTGGVDGDVPQETDDEGIVQRVSMNTSNGGQAYMPTGPIDMDLYRY